MPRAYQFWVLPPTFQGPPPLEMLLDSARHCGFRPRLCAPYRAQTKGKVERFLRYLRQSFCVPLASRPAQEGLIVDRETANLAVSRWLREVANVRVHGTTGGIPAERLAIERVQLQPVPTSYGGRSARSLQRKPVLAPIVGLLSSVRGRAKASAGCDTMALQQAGQAGQDRELFEV